MERGDVIVSTPSRNHHRFGSVEASEVKFPHRMAIGKLAKTSFPRPWTAGYFSINAVLFTHSIHLDK
jgi:hypothetical protein